MKIAEILKLEQNNAKGIILHHEGLFCLPRETFRI